MLAEMIERLKGVALFESIPADDLARLVERSERHVLPAGSHLISPWGRNDITFVILQGKVQVERNHPALTQPVVLAEFGPGEILGGIGLLNGGPHPVSIIAVEDTDVIELNEDMLTELLLERKEEAETLSRILSRRIAQTDEPIKPTDITRKRRRGHK